MDSLTPTSHIVAIHQPNYLPWIGYFIKMSVCNTFVFLDHVEINKSGVTRRTPLNSDAQGNPNYLTLPLQKLHDHSVISSLKLDENKDWRQYHLSRFRQVNEKGNFTKDITDQIEQWFTDLSHLELMSELNMALIKNIANLLDIKVKYISSTNLLPINGHKDEANLSIAQNCGASHYVSGTGSKAYQNAPLFHENGIQLIESPTMNRLENAQKQFPTLDFRTSIINCLCQIGTEETKRLIQVN